MDAQAVDNSALPDTLDNAVSHRVPQALEQLLDTEKKIGGIIDWCSYNYQKSDKEVAFQKAQEYSGAVLQNVLFYIHNSSKELLHLIDLEFHEVDLLTTKVESIASRLEQAKRIKGEEELKKMATATTCPFKRKKKKVKINETVDFQSQSKEFIDFNKLDNIGLSIGKKNDVTASTPRARTTSISAPKASSNKLFISSPNVAAPTLDAPTLDAPELPSDFQSSARGGALNSFHKRAPSMMHSSYGSKNTSPVPASRGSPAPASPAPSGGAPPPPPPPPSASNKSTPAPPPPSGGAPPPPPPPPSAPAAPPSMSKPAPPPAPAGGAPPPPPPPPSAPAPPPMSKPSGGSAPPPPGPPPPPSGGPPPPPPGPPPPVKASSAPAAPPPPSDGGDRGDLLASIRAGSRLRKVERPDDSPLKNMKPTGGGSGGGGPKPSGGDASGGGARPAPAPAPSAGGGDMMAQIAAMRNKMLKKT